MMMANFEFMLKTSNNCSTSHLIEKGEDTVYSTSQSILSISLKFLLFLLGELKKGRRYKRKI